MTENLQIDGQWLVAQLIALNEKVAPIPKIEEHLETQNASIAKTVETCSENARVSLRNARRVKLLEDAAKAAAKRREANWTMVVGSGLKIVEGLVLAFLLIKALGWA